MPSGECGLLARALLLPLPLALPHLSSSAVSSSMPKPMVGMAPRACADVRAGGTLPSAWLMRSWWVVRGLVVPSLKGWGWPGKGKADE